MTIEPTIIAANVLAMARKIDPYMPKPDPEMVNAWAHLIAKKPLPPALYYESVQDFYLTRPGEHLDIGNLIKHAKIVRDQWETDPQHREILKAHRQTRQDERDAQIAAGTFAGARSLSQAPKNTSPATFMQQLEAKRHNNAPKTRQNTPTSDQQPKTR